VNGVLEREGLERWQVSVKFRGVSFPQNRNSLKKEEGRIRSVQMSSKGGKAPGQ